VDSRNTTHLFSSFARPGRRHPELHRKLGHPSRPGFQLRTRSEKCFRSKICHFKGKAASARAQAILLLEWQVSVSTLVQIRVSALSKKLEFSVKRLSLVALPSLVVPFGVSQTRSTPQLAGTPPMGWNSWNWFAEKVTDQDIRYAADLLVSSGMRDAGYVYVSIDDTWEGSPDASYR
jgi:hypothetical protein